MNLVINNVGYKVQYFTSPQNNIERSLNNGYHRIILTKFRRPIECPLYLED